MVKLFVGNLSDAVDSHRLKNLFLQYGFNVQECDVLKNFAFVVRLGNSGNSMALNSRCNFSLFSTCKMRTTLLPQSRR